MVAVVIELVSRLVNATLNAWVPTTEPAWAAEPTMTATRPAAIMRITLPNPYFVNSINIISAINVLVLLGEKDALPPIPDSKSCRHGIRHDRKLHGQRRMD